MCGICGKVSPQGVRTEELKSMLRTIMHRGPDDEGVYAKGRIGLGTRRLSIIDLPGGHQPICNEDGTIWIVFNGEIYNYQSLRRDLEGRGHYFFTQSDTEVIVHLYEDFGENCVEKLKGMFAFAIWDEIQGKLVLARDRIGQKPLFYAQDGEDFLFASEIKAILAVSQRPREVDFESLYHYLSLRFVPSPRTMLRDIRKLPPAHVLVYQDGSITLSRYWDLSFQHKLELNEPDILEELQEKLTQTVGCHLVSDVPIGAYLSGGLDSSMIVAVMARDLGQSFRTFSVGVEEDDFNELPYARQVAAQYRTEHVEKCVHANLIDLLPRMIWHLDEPSDPIAACMYHAAELASRHVKVVLGGDGGDELFAGFDRYVGIGYLDAYATIPALIRESIFEPVIDRLPDNFAYKNLTQKARWAHYLSSFSSLGERYAEATCFFRFNHQGKRMLFSNGLWDQLGEINSADVIVEQYELAEAHDPIDRMLYADFMTRLPEHSLMLTDRMTMAHGLEARSPYLDHELVAYVAALPSSMKIRGRTTKYLFRQLAQNYLPDEIVRRKKQGFMLPIAYWFRNQLHPFVKQVLSNSFFVKQGIFHEVSVLRMLDEHKNGRADHHVRLWMLLNLEIWHQLYIQGKDLGFVEGQLRSYL
ncbi:MAG TPA: asparagine synthase (glutamine-hydrolyzing) [Anaerolineales bacterium]